MQLHHLDFVGVFFSLFFFFKGSNSQEMYIIVESPGP